LADTGRGKQCLLSNADETHGFALI
jgi:S1-C subfamily serine protease/DNA-binding NarL/FixJ family response regulator